MRTIDEYLEDARRLLDRVTPDRFDEEVEAGAFVVDVRDSALRDAQGPLEGATHIDLTVLEWRLSPSSENRIVTLEPAQRVIVVCNEGYSSSLAAVRLQQVGVLGATDLVGVITALREWRANQRCVPFCGLQ